MNWLDHSRTFREQGVEESETLLLRRKFFYSDQNVDSRDPVQLNLLYVQVNTHVSCWCYSKKKKDNLLVLPLCCTPPGWFMDYPAIMRVFKVRQRAA